MIQYVVWYLRKPLQRNWASSQAVVWPWPQRLKRRISSLHEHLNLVFGWLWFSLHPEVKKSFTGKSARGTCSHVNKIQYCFMLPSRYLLNLQQDKSLNCYPMQTRSRHKSVSKDVKGVTGNGNAHESQIHFLALQISDFQQVLQSIVAERDIEGAVFSRTEPKHKQMKLGSDDSNSSHARECLCIVAFCNDLIDDAQDWSYYARYIYIYIIYFYIGVLLTV